jgi:hypothetical protein
VERREITELSDTDRVNQIEKRITEMAKLYREWSDSARMQYRALNGASIAFSAAVPVIVLIAPLFGADTRSPWIASVAGILGACATLCKSIDSLFKNHDTWLRNTDAFGRLRSSSYSRNVPAPIKALDCKNGSPRMQSGWKV